MPTLEPFADELYNEQLPAVYTAQDAATGYTLATLLQAICGPLFDQIVTYARDTAEGDPGWSLLLDAGRCPTEALGWQAQLKGVTLPTGLSDAQQRAQIAAAGGQNRGKPSAIIAAAQQYLSGAQTVILRERNGGDAYQLSVIVYEDQVTDWTALQAAATRAIPGGIVPTITQLPGQDYTTLDGDYASYTAVRAAYGTYDDVRDDTP